MNPESSVSEASLPAGKAPSVKPRVLFLVTEDWYFCLHRLSLGQAVRDAGYEVIVATHVAEQGDRITAEGFKLIPIRLSRSSRNPFAELMAIAELVSIYRRERPDVVHHVAMKPILYGSWAAHIARQRVIVNAFAGLGYVFTGVKWSTRMASHVIGLMLRSAFRGSSAITMFQNSDDYETLRERGIVKPGRSTIIRGSGVDEKEFVPCPEPPGDPVILLAGRMLWDKGIGEFVEAARTIKSRGTVARFVLAGRRDPSNPSSIAEAQLRGWEAEGILEWWGQRDDMPEVVRQAHIVALPSYREGLPKVLLEAAASTRPVVTTDVPGCREIVKNGENGLLVPARDAAALAEALITLIEDRNLRLRMGARGRQMVLEAFTVRHVTSQVLDVYTKLLRGTGLADER
jgi:glycosyltransferase involved in cell wall biosynthesis